MIYFVADMTEIRTYEELSVEDKIRALLVFAGEPIALSTLKLLLSKSTDLDIEEIEQTLSQTLFTEGIQGNVTLEWFDPNSPDVPIHRRVDPYRAPVNKFEVIEPYKSEIEQSVDKRSVIQVIISAYFSLIPSISNDE